MAHAPTHYARLVQGTIERVLSRPSVVVTIADLAVGSGLTPLQLAWLFHGMVGEPLDGFISRICLERAVARLVTTDQPLAAVAEDVGYKSLTDFEAAFKAAFTTSPRLFRRLRTPRFELPATCGIHYHEDVDPPLFLPVDTNGRFLPVRARDLPALRLAVSTAPPLRSMASAPVQALRATLGDRVHPFVRRSPAPPTIDDLPGAFVVPHLAPGGDVALGVAIPVRDDVVLPPGTREVTIPAGFVVCCHVVEGETAEQTWRRFIGEWLPSSAERLRPVPLLEALISEPLEGPAAGQRPVLELCLPVV